MQIVALKRTPYGFTPFTGRAESKTGLRYIFFADFDGGATVFRERNDGGFRQIKPDTPAALSLAIRRAVRKAVQ